MKVRNNRLHTSAAKPLRGCIVVNDRLLKMLLIPLLGGLLLLLSCLVNPPALSWLEGLFSFLFFMVVAQLTWQGSVQILSALRQRPQNIFFKLLLISAASVVYGVTVGFFSVVGWQLVVLKQVVLPSLYLVLLAISLVSCVLTLVYEAIFLSAEAELNTKVMQQLEWERLQAEAQTLRNDLDPHFLFNCLNTLSYLIRNDSELAYQFLHRLSNVFKYLLISKQKAFVPLKEELAFLADYYFLLQVRFDEAIRIEHDMKDACPEELTLPGTLQALVENAIKQNLFSEKEPLVISIALNPRFITVSTTVAARQNRPPSPKAALSELVLRYRSLLNKELVVQQSAQEYRVKVPRIKQPAA